MQHPGLLPRVRRQVQLLEEYVRALDAHEKSDEYIVAPALEKRAGVLGAIALAEHATPHPI